MEVAVEVQKLLAISLEGSVGYQWNDRPRSHGLGLTTSAERIRSNAETGPAALPAAISTDVLDGYRCS
jgi:hypothetical protein